MREIYKRRSQDEPRQEELRMVANSQGSARMRKRKRKHEGRITHYSIITTTPEKATTSYR
eukprot:6510497-Pyramimonas_sp.AAC.1